MQLSKQQGVSFKAMTEIFLNVHGKLTSDHNKLERTGGNRETQETKKILDRSLDPLYSKKQNLLWS